MTTPLYATFQKRVNDAVEQLIVQQVTPWSFLMTGRPFRVKRFDGMQIAYEGVKFVGSPREVFWSGYIEPFLEDLIVSEIAAAVAMAKERNVDGRLLLAEVQTLLSVGCRRVYAHMADADRRLMANGRPERIKPRPIEGEARAMDHFLESRIHAELEMWRPNSRLEIWYQGNLFWVWLIGVIIGISGLLIALSQI